MTIERKTNGKILNVDVDGTIAMNNGGDYINAAPIPYAIKQINKAYDLGYKILICTARYGDRMKGCVAKQYQAGFIELINWLNNNGVKYDEVVMGKPAADLYIDDKGYVVSHDDNSTWDALWPRLEALNKVNKYNQPITELEKQAENLKEFKQ